MSDKRMEASKKYNQVTSISAACAGIMFVLAWVVIVIGIVLKSGGIVVLGVLLIVFSAFIAFYLGDQIAKSCKQKVLDEYEKEKKEKDKKDENKQNCIKFAQRVKELELDIDETNASENVKELEMVKDSMHTVAIGEDVVEEYKKALKYIEEEENLKREEEKREQEEKQTEYIRELEEMMEAQKQISNLVGRDKYLKPMEERLIQAKEKEEELKKAQEQVGQVMGMLAASGYSNDANEGLDWKTSALAGAATAFGGPMAGMMVISDAMMNQTKNKRNYIDPREAAERRMIWIDRSFTPAMKKADKMINELDVKGLEKKIDSFNLLIDTDNQAEKSKNIKAIVKGYSVVTPYEMYVDLCFDTNDVRVLNQPAIIDGSFNVRVFDGNEEIASGMLCGGGYGVLDVNEIGFEDKNFRVFCYSKKGLIKDEKEFEVEASWNKLWYVEYRKI